MKPELLKGSRSRILAGIILAIGAIFVIRLFYLQIIQHEYKYSADSNAFFKKTLYPARGTISAN